MADAPATSSAVPPGLADAGPPGGPGGATTWRELATGEGIARAASGGVENVRAAQGLEIAGAGLIVVFTALAAITVVLSILPRAVGLVTGLLPHGDDGPGGTVPTHHEAEIALAIAVAHARRRRPGTATTS